MSMTIATPDAVEEAVLKVRHRITVEESRTMAESGALGPEPKLYELIKGVIVERMTEGPDHIQSCLLLAAMLHRVVPPGHVVSEGHPIVVPHDDSAPVPDLMILRGQIRDYAGRDLNPADAALVIEVASTSLARDKGWKKDLYAEMGVPEYWVVNLVDRVMEIDRDPARPEGGGPARFGTSLAPVGADARAQLVLGGAVVHEFPVRDILP